MACRGAMISVIIPIYSRVKYLEACLQSLADQTHRELEILCVMDGYSPQIAEVLNRWERNDIRFRIIEIPHQGAATARNAGLEQAKGKYLTFVDADDLIPPDALDCLYREIIDTGADVVIGDYQELLDNGTCLSFVTPSGEKDDFNSFLESVVVWNRLYNHAYIKAHQLWFDARFRGDDRIFLTELFLTRPRISVINKVVYFWLRHDLDEEASVTHGKAPEFFLNDISMWHTFMDKMEREWSEHMHEHMRYSCFYIKDCFERVEICSGRLQAFQAFQQLVRRIQWDGFEKLFSDIFGMSKEAFFALSEDPF